jgi:cytochrome b561
MPSEQVQNFARAAHDVGLAVWYGGTVFGKFALNPAVKSIQDETARGQAANAAWAAFHPLGGVGLAAAAVVRFTARQTELQPVNLSPTEKVLATAGDVLMVTSIGLTLASGIFGQRLASKGSVPMESGTQPTAGTPPEVAKLQKSNEVLGNSTVLAGLGLLTVQAIQDRVSFSRPSKKRLFR